MICTLKAERLVIEWLYVAASCRAKGAGEQFIREAFETAVQGGIQEVCAAFSPTEQWYLLFPNAEEYFEGHLFMERTELPGEWKTDVGTIRAHSSFRQQADENYQISPLRHLTGAKRREVIAALDGLESVATLYPLKDGGQMLDQDVSLLLFKNGKPQGVFLMQCTMSEVQEVHAGKIMTTGERQTLYPVLLQAGSDKAAGALLSAVVREMTAKYPPDTMVHIILRDSSYASLMEKLLPDAHIDSWFLTAKTDDYVRWKEVKERYLK